MADDSSEDVQGALAPVLKISPNEISFSAPFTKSPEVKVLLVNPSEDAIAFKIRTTAPKRYCVRPNTGIVPPKEKIEVQVVLNVSKDPINDLNQRDKFQILSTTVKDAQKVAAGIQDPTSVKDLFDKAAAVPTMKQKLRCYFRPAPGAPGAPVADASKKKSSKAPETGTVGAPQAPQVNPQDSPQVTFASPQAAPKFEKPTSDSIGDRYSSALLGSDSGPEQSGLRQRTVESSAPKPAATLTSPPTAAVSKPALSASAAASSGSKLPTGYLVYAVIFFVGIWVGITLNRMFS